MTTLNSLATVVAALAALITVYYARRTVNEAERARKSATDASDSQIRTLEALNSNLIDQGDLQLRRMNAEVNRAAEQYEATLVLRRQTQLEGVANIAIELADVARSEYQEPPGLLEPESGSLTTLTRVPALQARLRTAVAILAALDGPDLSDRLPEPGRGDKPSSLRIWRDSITLLLVIEMLPMSGTASFTLPHRL